jgi:hypothetical protein
VPSAGSSKPRWPSCSQAGSRCPWRLLPSGSSVRATGYSNGGPALRDGHACRNVPISQLPASPSRSGRFQSKPRNASASRPASRKIPSFPSAETSSAPETTGRLGLKRAAEACAAQHPSLAADPLRAAPRHRAQGPPRRSPWLPRGRRPVWAVLQLRSISVVATLGFGLEDELHLASRLHVLRLPHLGQSTD